MNKWREISPNFQGCLLSKRNVDREGYVHEVVQSVGFDQILGCRTISDCVRLKCDSHASPTVDNGSFRLSRPSHLQTEQVDAFVFHDHIPP